MCVGGGGGVSLDLLYCLFFNETWACEFLSLVIRLMWTKWAGPGCLLAAAGLGLGMGLGKEQVG